MDKWTPLGMSHPMRVVPVILMLGLASCQKSPPELPVLKLTQKLPDGTTATLLLSPSKLALGDGFTCTVAGLPVVASHEAQQYLEEFHPLASPQFSISGPSLALSFVSSAKDKPQSVELQINHRFVQQITSVAPAGERAARSFAPALMPQATIKAQ